MTNPLCQSPECRGRPSLPHRTMVLENRPAVLLPVWLMCLLALSRKPSQFCFGSKAVWTQHMEHSHISLSGFGEGPLPGYVDGAFIKPMGQLGQQGFGADLAQSCHFTRKEGRGRRRKLE